MRVLVTGAAGFIGSHLTEALAADGIQVRALVRYGSQSSWGWLEHLSAPARDSLEIISGDLRDSECMNKAARGCEIIYHLGALISIPYSYESPRSYIDVNVIGTHNVLQAAREAGVQRVVVTSTSEVYGSAQSVPMTEEHRLHPQSPYAASKVAADQLALSFHRSFGLPVTVFRPFNTFGPRQSARAIVPTIITQLLSSGGKLKLGSLTPTRDLTFVEDTVAAFRAVAQSPRSVGEVIHAGSGGEVSIGNLVKLLSEITEVQAVVETDEQRVRPQQSEVTRLWACNDKMNSLTGWQPKYRGLDGMRRGLEKTVEWFKNPDHLRYYKSSIYNR